LEELEKLYRDEQVTRKRYFNQMEDMKGKIRVFCRIRPILQFETDKGQQFALNLPDELTITHPWRDEKKPREYNFDMVSPCDLLLTLMQPTHPLRTVHDEQKGILLCIEGSKAVCFMQFTLCTESVS
jgi:hypothetical protein